MDHGMRVRPAALLLLAVSAASVPAADKQAEAYEKARRRADEVAKAGMVQQAPARFPTKEALGSAATPGGALALWGQLSPVLRERMLRANRTVGLSVMGTLQGADMSVANVKTEAQRGVALAQIQATCATFLSAPGIPMTADERDLLAAYAARVGEARLPRDGKRAGE